MGDRSSNGKLWGTATSAASAGAAGRSFRRHEQRARKRRGLGHLARVLLSLVAIHGGSRLAEAFPGMAATTTTTTTTTRRFPLAITVRNGPRKRPIQWLGTRDENEAARRRRRYPHGGAFRRGPNLEHRHGRRRSRTGSASRSNHAVGRNSGGGGGSALLHLFFNRRDEEGNLVRATPPKKKARPTAGALKELRSEGVSFPKEVELDDPSSRARVYLRYMTTEDLRDLVPMCINEFGNEFQQQQLQHQQTTASGRFRRTMPLPRWLLDPKQIPDLWEGFSFEMLIYWTLRLKLMQGSNTSAMKRRGDNSDSDNDNDDILEDAPENPFESSKPADPVMLVLCERNKNAKKDDTRKTATKAAASTETIVGMVELSLQPPDADRNPPAVPIPLWAKEVLAKQTTEEGSLVGWVTNLLVDDSRRGRGYSKILMAAVEGIAKHDPGWETCSSIYLHADADVQSGKVPQSLYEGLGYELVQGSTRKKKKSSSSNNNNNNNKGDKRHGANGTAGGNNNNNNNDDDDSNNDPYGWAGLGGKGLERFTAIRMVDGVALLCYRKKL